MRKSARCAITRGFTLIELLVVVAIMAVIGVYTLSNYKSFGEDQNLKSAVLDIQSQLRTAQTNATSNTQCVNKFGAIWEVEFLNSKTINLRCIESVPLTALKKTLTLGPNIEIQSASGIGSSCPTALPFIIDFAPLTGKITFGSTGCISLTTTLRNTKTGSTKSFTVEQGGRIYAQ